MRAAALACSLGACALAACSDPTLRVTIDLPAPYRAMITSVSLADYERAGLTCDAIAYGDEPAQALDGALTTQVDVAPGGEAALTGIARVDHKVLVARGRDAAGELVVAGCRDLDTLDGDVAIDLPTVPAALVTVDARRPDAPLDVAAPIAVHVLDPLGQPLDQRDVVWRVFGPKALPGGMPGDPACPQRGVDGCVITHAGAASVAAAPPAQPGPALVEIHVAWARAQPAPVAAFQSPMFATFALRTLLKPVPSPSCVAYRAASGARVACIAVATGGTTEVQHFAWNGSAIAKQAGSPSVPNAIALIAAPGGAADRVVAITDGGDFVDGTTGVTIGHAELAGHAAVGAQLVPACGKSAFVVIGLDNGSVVTTDPSSAALSTFVSSPPSRAFTLAATGCISDLAAPATQYRGVVLIESKSNMTSVPFAQIDCPGAPCTPTWLGLGDGVGFVAAAGGEARLASGRLDLSGVVIEESRIDPSRDPIAQLASVATHDSISVPSAIASGDLDGDGAPDRAWLLVGGGLRPPGRLQVELAATTPDGVPIAGVSPEIGAQPAGLIVANLDGDAIDDVIVYSADAVTIFLAGRAP